MEKIDNKTNEYPKGMDFDPDNMDFDTYHYKKGQSIFNEGSYPFGLYFIKCGKVKIFKLGLDGKEKILRIAKEGEFIGYRDLINGEKYSHSAVAFEETTLYFISRDNFDDLMKSSEILLYFFRLASIELTDTEQDLVDMAYKPVRGRLIEALLELNDNKDNGSPTINISREDLACFIGSATETVIRLLSSLKKENVISIDGRMISILDNNRLSYFNQIYN